jgi:hypothetical protein
MGSLIIATVTVSASAQAAAGPRLGLSQSAVHDVRLAERPLARDSVAPSHWQEGMLIGAFVGAGIGVVLSKIGEGIADTPQGGKATGVILVSALVFGLIGGMIGSGRPKK